MVQDDDILVKRMQTSLFSNLRISEASVTTVHLIALMFAGEVIAFCLILWKAHIKLLPVYISRCTFTCMATNVCDILKNICGNDSISLSHNNSA